MKRRVVVIGLGIFGSQLARQLYESGMEVVAVDKDKDVVQRIKDFCTAGNPQALRINRIDLLFKLSLQWH